MRTVWSAERVGLRVMWPLAGCAGCEFDGGVEGPGRIAIFLLVTLDRKDIDRRYVQFPAAIECTRSKEPYDSQDCRTTGPTAACALSSTGHPRSGYARCAPRAPVASAHILPHVPRTDGAGGLVGKPTADALVVVGVEARGQCRELVALLVVLRREVSIQRPQGESCSQGRAGQGRARHRQGSGDPEVVGSGTSPRTIMQIAQRASSFLAASGSLAPANARVGSRAS